MYHMCVVMLSVIIISHLLDMHTQTSCIVIHIFCRNECTSLNTIVLGEEKREDKRSYNAYHFWCWCLQDPFRTSSCDVHLRTPLSGMITTLNPLLTNLTLWKELNKNGGRLVKASNTSDRYLKSRFVNGFVGTCIYAYNLHLHLVLSPDAVWIAITTSMSRYYPSFPYFHSRTYILLGILMQMRRGWEESLWPERDRLRLSLLRWWATL